MTPGAVALFTLFNLVQEMTDQAYSYGNFFPDFAYQRVKVNDAQKMSQNLEWQ